ncbi:DNA ligase D [Oceanobacillus massiliensis]|uniref:DNA ligase D n=1 Tax=Oceanobacillus massiliensis TaxID=1465765 RepID=UPI003015B51B
MDLMKPIASSAIPDGDDWIYQVKYDGFRCVLTWEIDGTIQLTSKNNKDLTEGFPEIAAFCLENHSVFKPSLPLRLDGELVILNHLYQADFPSIQKRGRLKNKVAIQKSSEERPAVLMVFDILEIKGSSCKKQKYSMRMKVLEGLFRKLKIAGRIQLVTTFTSIEAIKKIVFDAKGEGIVAKRKTSSYIAGKSHQDWFKIKNWRTIQGFLTEYDLKNAYFNVTVYRDGEYKSVGKCKHGLDTGSFQTLKQLFLSNGEKQEQRYQLPPAICTAVHTLDLYDDELREPEFAALLPDAKPEDCTEEKLQLDLAMIPAAIEPTNTDKLLWPDALYSKGNLLSYMRELSPYMLPFLQNRMLTVIRCPDGIDKEHFFQKHLPDYAPDFIESFPSGEDKAIVCNNLESLVWFANHGAVEYHVPFQTIHSSVPTEIAFDLDPPDREHFHLAIRAATLIKAILDDLELHSFIKTSGNKGLQIYIPIRTGSMTYEETATFTQAIAWTIENTYPELFTTERMKKKRKNRLYIDYVQHGKDKTLIAPYSPRMTKEGTIATPLFWKEVKEGLHPTQFTLGNILGRIQKWGCPFADYFQTAEVQRLDKVLRLVRD